MAGNQLLAPLPWVTLDAGCTVTFEAIDPLTGVAVTGVVVTAATIYATNDAETTLPPAPVPLLTLEAPTGGPGGT